MTEHQPNSEYGEMGGILSIGGGGTELIGKCPSCGIVPATIGMTFLRTPPVYVRDSVGECSKCGQLVPILDGLYTFAEKVVPILEDADLTRQQVRRFNLKARKAKSIDSLELSAKTINPALEQVVREAKKEIDPLRAISVAAAIALFVFGAFGGVDSADNVWDKYQKGELFEQYRDDGAPGVDTELDREAEEETKRKNRGGPEPDPNEPIDV